VGLIVVGNMRGAVCLGHLLVCWSWWGATVPVTKMGTFYGLHIELLETKCIFKHILLQQNEIGLMGGTRWNLV
jgi:hypothetical protein